MNILNFSFPFSLIKHKHFKYVNLQFKSCTNFMIIEHQHAWFLVDNIIIYINCGGSINNRNIVFRCGIRSVINLQRPGEHATCGPNELKSGGFSYDPEEFMSKDGMFKMYVWIDTDRNDWYSIVVHNGSSYLYDNLRNCAWKRHCGTQPCNSYSKW